MVDSVQNQSKEGTMNRQPHPSQPSYGMFPAEAEGYDPLAELALDTHRSWNRATDDIWRYLHHEVWDLPHCPLDILLATSPEKIRVLLADPAILPSYPTRKWTQLRESCPVVTMWRFRSKMLGSRGNNKQTLKREV